MPFPFVRCTGATTQTCDLASCPSLWCNPSLQYTPNGECCPICPPLPLALHIPAPTSGPSGCTGDNGKHHDEGDTWQRDACTTCMCRDGVQLCSAIACAIVTCSNPIEIPGQCCPVCLGLMLVYPAPATASGECRVGDEVYKNGESWVPDKTKPCQRGYCDEGEVFYISRQCSVPHCDNPIYSEDTCCPTCPDNGGHSTDAPTPTTEAPLPQVCIWNDVELREGESHCPAPNVTAVCHSGEWEYSYHCPSVDCPNPVEGQEPCDCPFCPGKFTLYTYAYLNIYTACTYP